MLKQLRQTEKGQKIPVILVTTSTSCNVIPHIDKVDLLLQKPVMTLELKTMVKRLLL